MFLLLTISALAGIVWEDFKFRMVNLYWYALLFLGLLGLSINRGEADLLLLRGMTNLGFVLTLLISMTLYFSIKAKRWQLIFDHHIGWGDILLLVIIALALDIVNYILFIIISLLIALLLTPIIFWLQGADRHIPLAGIQAACLMGYLIIHYIA